MQHLQHDIAARQVIACLDDAPGNAALAQDAQRMMHPLRRLI